MNSSHNSNSDQVLNSFCCSCSNFKRDHQVCCCSSGQTQHAHSGCGTELSPCSGARKCTSNQERTRSVRLKISPRTFSNPGSQFGLRTTTPTRVDFVTSSCMVTIDYTCRGYICGASPFHSKCTTRTAPEQPGGCRAAHRSTMPPGSKNNNN